MQTTTVQGRRIKTVLTCFDYIANLLEARLRTKVSSARLRLETYARPLPKSHPSLLKKSWSKNLLAWISASQELVEEASCIGAATGCDAGLCNVCDASLHGGPHELAEALTATTVRSLQTLICIPPASGSAAGVCDAASDGVPLLARLDSHPFLHYRPSLGPCRVRSQSSTSVAKVNNCHHSAFCSFQCTLVSSSGIKQSGKHVSSSSRQP